VKTLSLVATAVLAVAVVLLLFRRWLFAIGPAAIALQVLAALLMLWARLTFGVRSFHAGANPSEGGLVTRGPYHFIRHPIYAAILLFVWAGAASHAAVSSLSLAAIATVATAVRITAEEHFLRAAYPEYAAYAARTRRVIPFIL
jgi:protein-S-isoprenylcysteine O-methyltransferase Ste14